MACTDDGATPITGETTMTPVTCDTMLWSRGGMHPIQSGLGSSPFSAYMETLTPLQQPAPQSADRLSKAERGLLPSRANSESDFCAGLSMRPIVLTPAAGQHDSLSFASPLGVLHPHSPGDASCNSGGAARGPLHGGNSTACVDESSKTGLDAAAACGVDGVPYAATDTASGGANVENVDSQRQPPLGKSLAACEIEDAPQASSLVLPGEPGVNLSSSFDAVLSQPPPEEARASLDGERAVAPGTAALTAVPVESATTGLVEPEMLSKQPNSQNEGAQLGGLATKQANRRGSHWPRRLRLPGSQGSTAEQFDAMGVSEHELQWDKVINSLAASNEQQSFQALFDDAPINALLRNNAAVPSEPQPTPTVPTTTARSKSRQGRPKRCNCKNSKCLKLYCDCFSAGQFCNGCNCVNCHNTEDKREERDEARKQVLQRNPKAFNAKFANSPTRTGALQRHVKGCNCKNSKCLKNYCECFQMGVSCTAKCKCKSCENGKGTDGDNGSNNVSDIQNAVQQAPTKAVAEPALKAADQQYAVSYPEGTIEDVMQGFNFDELDEEQSDIFAMNALMCNEELDSHEQQPLPPQQQQQQQQTVAGHGLNFNAMTMMIESLEAAPSVMSSGLAH